MPGNPMLRHQLTGSGAGTPKVEGVEGAAKKAARETAEFVVDQGIGVLDMPFEAFETGKKIGRKIDDSRRKREAAKKPRHRPVRDERKIARTTILPGPPGESMGGGTQVDKHRMPKRAPKKKE